MEHLAEYVELCRRIGPWTDWVQGGGGNCSIKQGDELLVKRSGARIADTTHTSGWVMCSIEKILACVAENRENTEGAQILGDGKPSIEAFFHTLPARVIVHCHPVPLLGRLCSSTPIVHVGCRWIPYSKPGVQLAKQILDVHSTETTIYFLQNHGVIILGNSIEEILEKMVWISNTFFSAVDTITDILLASRIYSHLKMAHGVDKVIKTWKSSIQWMDRLFIPYTPDSIVFLQQGAVVVEDDGAGICAQIDRYVSRYSEIPTVVFCKGTLYLIAPTQSQAFDILEIFLGYMAIPPGCLPLTSTQNDEITGWDKEKARKQGSNA
jgi:rhamnose utilization protein RhaD (predicted bifunctional aldolase and dehydrogenase)